AQPSASAEPPTEHLAAVDSPNAQDDMDSSPLDDFEAEEPGKSRWGKGLLITLLTLIVLGGAYGAAAWYLGDQVPSGTTVAGVNIGGLSDAEARERLEEDLANISAEPVPVSLQDSAATIDPTEVGLRLDLDATLGDLTGFTLDPRALANH